MMKFDDLSPVKGLIAVGIMTVIIVMSNILVQPQYHLNAWLTWGAITYPFAFLVTDLLNRRFGPVAARRVVVIGFIVAVVISYFYADARIAIASGSAFLLAHLADIFVFDKLRRKSWWKAPFIAGFLASFVDTYIFFGMAFIGTGIPWLTLGLGDLVIKLAMNLFLLLPFRALMWNLGNQSVSKN